MPRVFVSYSWEGPAHQEWVSNFAFRLRKAGIDVKLDHWDLQLGDSLTHFMEREITEADRVLIVCTPTYKEKSDARTGGVGYEEGIISSELLASGNQRKFIPILREGDQNSAIPTGLKGKLFANLRSDDEQAIQRLIDTILGKLVGPPPLGQPDPAPGISSDSSPHEQDAHTSIDQPAGASNLEDQILTLLIKEAATTGQKYVQLASVLQDRHFAPEEVNDAIELLAEDGLLELDDMLGGDPYLWDSVTVPVEAFERVPAAVGFDLETTATRLARYVFDHGSSTGPQVAEGLGEPPARLNWAAAYIEHHGLAEVERNAGTHPFEFSEISPTARTRKLFRDIGLTQPQLASNRASAFSGLIVPRIQEVKARAEGAAWLSVFLAPGDDSPVTIDVDAKETFAALNAIRLPEEADGVNGTNINVYHTRPYSRGLINEDLRELASGRGHYSEIRQDGLLELAVCLDSSVKQVSEYPGDDDAPTPLGRLMRYTDLAHCVLTLVREIGALSSRLALSSPSVLTVVVTGTSGMRLYSRVEFDQPVLGHPVRDEVLEFQRPLLDCKTLDIEAEAALRYLVRCFGMFLPSVWDSKGKLIRPDRFPSN